MAACRMLLAIDHEMWVVSAWIGSGTIPASSSSSLTYRVP